MSIRESSAQAFECLREASKMLSILTIGNGWTGNSRSENMNCRSREYGAKACVWLREAYKMLSIRTIGNGWTGNSRSENMNCRSVNLVLKHTGGKGRPPKCCRSVPLVTDGLEIHERKI
jgi:hypothetical protein